jgi:PAS domain S-box-containing protein
VRTVGTPARQGFSSVNSHKTSSKTPREYAALAQRDGVDAVVVTTLQGEIVQWSEGAMRLYGYTAEEAAGRTLQDLLVPLDRSVEEERLRSRLLEDGTANFESVLRRKDGALVHVEMASRLFSEADTTVIVLAQRDVTRLRVLRDARLVEARFRELLESTPDGVVLVNASGHIVFANTQLAQLFGHPAPALQGRPVGPADLHAPRACSIPCANASATASS